MNEPGNQSDAHDLPVVVYRARAGRHALEVLNVLRRAGLAPCVLDKGDPDPVLRYTMRKIYTVPIAVAPEQAERAVAILADWEHEHDADADAATRELRWQLLRVVLVIVIGAAALRVATGGWDFAPYALVLVLAGVSIYAGVRHIIRSARSYPRGHCQTCGYNLRGNVSGRCPECGTPVPHRRRWKTRRR